MTTEKDHFDQLFRLTEEHFVGLIEDGARPQDVAGALLAHSVAITIADIGREAAAEHLFEVAARIKSGERLDFRTRN